jgi:hypothetical protein
MPNPCVCTDGVVVGDDADRGEFRNRPQGSARRRHGRTAARTAKAAAGAAQTVGVMLPLPDTMGHARMACELAERRAGGPDLRTWLVDAWSGSPGVDTVVTALVLAASRR